MEPPTLKERLRTLFVRNKLILDRLMDRPKNVTDFEHECKTLNRLEAEGIKVDELIEELLPLAWMEERIEVIERKLGILPGTMEDFRKRMDLLIRKCEG